MMGTQLQACFASSEIQADVFDISATRAAAVLRRPPMAEGLGTALGGAWAQNGSGEIPILV